MTIKPARTHLEREKEDAKIRYLRREQEETEAKRSLRDFLRQSKEEDDYEERDYTPPNPL